MPKRYEKKEIDTIVSENKRLTKENEKLTWEVSNYKEKIKAIIDEENGTHVAMKDFQEDPAYYLYKLDIDEKVLTDIAFHLDDTTSMVCVNAPTLTAQMELEEFMDEFKAKYKIL